RTHAVTATPRVASPVARGRVSDAAGCRFNFCKPLCNLATEAWGGFKDGFTRRQLSRRDQQRRRTVWRAIFAIIFIAAVYYTYFYKFVYYRQAYGYAQGYLDAARDFYNKKTQ
ncbi:hypothetical protein PFISCL1PPCAC_18416, partial [Pristionchus fissidentatus]